MRLLGGGIGELVLVHGGQNVNFCVFSEGETVGLLAALIQSPRILYQRDKGCARIALYRPNRDYIPGHALRALIDVFREKPDRIADLNTRIARFAY